MNQIYDAWKPEGGCNRVLFQIPFATGKEAIVSRIVKKAEQKNKTVLILVHCKSVSDMFIGCLREFDVIASEHSTERQENQHSLTCIGLISDLTENNFPPAEIVIIYDCHLFKTTALEWLLTLYPQSRFLGVSSAPTRKKGDTFTGIFDRFVSFGNLKYFFDNGLLSKVRHFACDVPDFRRVKLSGGDYQTKSLETIVMQGDFLKNLVDSYLDYAREQKIIVFALSNRHGQAIVKQYNSKGVSAMYVGASMEVSKRDAIFEDFEEERIKVLVIVDLFCGGGDLPSCRVIQLARPTKLLALYLHQVSFAMRSEEEKKFGIILDNVGAWNDHGISSLNRQWDLSGKDVQNPDIRKANSEHFIKVNVHGFGHEITNQDVEALGCEFVPIAYEREDFLAFEDCFRGTRFDRPMSHVFSFANYLFYNKKMSFLDAHIEYGQNKILQYSDSDFKKSNWYRVKKVVDERLISGLNLAPDFKKLFSGNVETSGSVDYSQIDDIFGNSKYPQ